MHILVVNDDGPPSYQSSPYVQSMVQTLQAAGHTVSVCLPHVQRSWIGKAHMIGQTLTPSYYRPGTVLKDDGTTSDKPFNDGKEEWTLIDGTPASCTQIGLHHLFKDKGPVDLVFCGPNYGRNTTAVFALSSGTIGGAMEGAVMGVKSIALSFAFDSRDHDIDIINGACRMATRVVEKLYKDWPEDVHLYSVNVPVREEVEKTKVVFTHMIQNRWTSGSSFTELPATATDADPNKEEQKIREDGDGQQVRTKRDHVTYKWSPSFADVREAVEKAGQGDGWEVIQGNVTITPLRANFWHLPQYTGELKLSDHEISSALSLRTTNPSTKTVHAVVEYPEPYVQPLILKALRDLKQLDFQIVRSIDDLPLANAPVLQFTAYEALNLDHAAEHTSTSLLCAYIIRKALIRKHYLSNTVSTWLVKHPDSVISKHFKPCVHFEVDFAEFLDEALVDAWDLNESLERNENLDSEESREWWILKPGMSDGGNGIRLFSSMSELQHIFDEWESEEVDSDEAEEDTDEGDASQDVGETGGMTSQLRHFIAQPYIDPPLILPAYGGRKFHIRTYVLAVGALKVFVYREMLALFAAKAYQSPQTPQPDEELDLTQHLTNTCFQDESTKETAVHRFWNLDEPSMSSDWKESVFSQICQVTGEVFESAAREQMVHFQAIPNAFEIFGVDFLVDASCNVWLLELNAYPDFKQTGQDLQDIVVGGLFEEVTKIAIAPFFGPGDDAGGTQQMPLVREVNLGRH